MGTSAVCQSLTCKISGANQSAVSSGRPRRRTGCTSLCPSRHCRINRSTAADPVGFDQIDGQIVETRLMNIDLLDGIEVCDFKCYNVFKRAQLVSDYRMKRITRRISIAWSSVAYNLSSSFGSEGATSPRPPILPVDPLQRRLRVHSLICQSLCFCHIDVVGVDCFIMRQTKVIQ